MKIKENTNISIQIKKWRKQKDLTQDALAKKANIPYTTLAKIESNVIQNPSLQTVKKIAEGLEIGLDDLVGKI